MTNLSSTYGSGSMGGVLGMYNWILKNGSKCPNVTLSSNETYEQNSIQVFNTLTVNTAVTVSGSRLLVILADTLDLQGSAAISMSAQGAAGSDGGIGNRMGLYLDSDSVRAVNTNTAFNNPTMYFSSDQSASAIGGYCGSGGGGSAYAGGGAYAAGGAIAGAGNDCTLTSAQIQQRIFSPLFNPCEMGVGGGGGGAATAGDGGGSLLIVARVITLSASCSIIANGEDGATNGGGAGGGCVLIVGNSITDAGATITANGGAASAGGGAGGDGVAYKITV